MDGQTAKTLYVSDLDGTLLRSDESISAHTLEVINGLTEKGMLFTYATGRSLSTARKVTAGLTVRLPVIVYNGAFLVDGVTGEVLLSNRFDGGVLAVLDDLFARGLFPIVYAHIEGKEKFSFVPDLCTAGMQKFIAGRRSDARANAVATAEELKRGDIFYITCIDAPEKLRPAYGKYREMFHCVMQADIYTGEPWLEIMPAAASKANAVRHLKELLGCGRVVAFGDGKNDIDMLRLADEGYAVGNADQELKAHATAVIQPNNNDGVARWLAQAQRAGQLPEAHGAQ